MISVWVVEMVTDQVIGVVAVRDGLVAAVGAVLMPGFVLVAVVPGRALSRIRVADRDRVALHVVACVMVQFTVVQVVDVVVVSHRGVAAAGSVFVVVGIAHVCSFTRRCASRGLCC